MISVDTDIIVRLLTGDDYSQAEKSPHSIQKIRRVYSRNAYLGI